MVVWLNHAAINTARNGTTAHNNVDPATTGTVIAGAAFTPASGNLLLCFAEGAVTSTTPTGWTLPTSGSAINNTGLYVWWRSASGTSADQVSTTHNGSNYPVIFDFYEFAAGSTFVKAASATAVSNAGGAGPSLTALTGTNWTSGIAGQGRGATDAANTISWNAGTEAVDTSVASATTDGYNYSLTYTDNNAAASQSYAATFSTGAAGLTVERLVVAVNVAAGGAPAIPPILIMQTRRPF